MKHDLIKHGLLIVAFLFSAVSQQSKAEEATQTSLTPHQRQQIQTLGRAILASKRHAEHASESIAIRSQIKQVKVQLDALTAPVRTVKIELATPASSARISSQSEVPLGKISKMQGWRQSRATQLKKLESAMAQLKAQCDNALDKREEPQPSFLQRLKARVIKSQAVTTSEKPVVTSLSDAALKRLNTLQTEINAALSLPEDERHQQLVALSRQLQINPFFPASTVEQGTEGSEVTKLKMPTPTMTSRTTHRRQF